MFPFKPRPRPVFWAVGAAILLADQLTKLWARQSLRPLHEIEVVRGFFSLTYVENTGMAFGLGGGQNYFFLALALLLLAAGIFFASGLDWSQMQTNLAAAALAAGAIGNLLDRLWLGYVVDFLDFYCGSWHWPAFNVADSAICLSVLWILFCQLKPRGLKP